MRFGRVTLPPLPSPGAETIGQEAARKSRVRYQGPTAFAMLFQALGAHLGKPEANRLLQVCAEALAKSFKGKNKDKDTATNDCLLLADNLGSLRKAAKAAYEHKLIPKAASVEAIEKRIQRLGQAGAAERAQSAAASHQKEFRKINSDK
jgi:hypothetical protein